MAIWQSMAQMLPFLCNQRVEKAVLFTRESNIAAQKAYTALGFGEIGDYRLMLLRSPVEIV